VANPKSFIMDLKIVEPEDVYFLCKPEDPPSQTKTV
jgi:hypothetical protein